MFVDYVQKARRAYTLTTQLLSNDYNALTGEIIDGFFSTLIGEGQKNLFKAGNKAFDPEVLRKVANKVADAFFLYLARNDDSYGITESGERVTHYNKSVFSMIIKKHFPDVGGVVGLSLKILDNAKVKAFIQDRVVETIIHYLPKSFKEEMGKQTVSAGEFMLCGESTELPEVWKYLSHHIHYYVRSFIVEELKKQKKRVIDEIEKSLWYVAVPTSAAVSATTLFLNSYYFSSLFAPSLIYSGSTTLLTLAKDKLNSCLDTQLELWATYFLPRSQEEHVVYWSHPNPSPIHKNLAFEDYQLLERLNSPKYIEKFVNSVLEVSGMKYSYNLIYDYIYGKEYVSQVKYCPAEDYLKGYRQLTLLQEEDPEKAYKVLKDLEKYPSYSVWKSKSSLSKHERNTDLSRSTQQFAQHIQEVSATLADDLSQALVQQVLSQLTLEEQQSELLALKEQLFPVFKDAIMNSNVEAQDYIISWAEEHQDDLKRFAKEFAEKTKYNDVFEETADKKIIIKKEKIDQFFQEVLQRDIKKFIEQENLRYFEANGEDFKRLSITEGLDTGGTAKLHKHFTSYKAKNRNFFKKISFDVTNVVLSFLDIENLYKFSTVNRGYYKYVRDRIDAQKLGNLFTTNTLNNDERNYFMHHYHDMVLIKEAYDKLKLDCLTFILCDILNTHLKEKGVIEIVKDKVKAEMAKDNASKPNVAELVTNIMNKEPEFILVSKWIRPLKKSDPALEKAYDNQRMILMQEIADSMEEKGNKNSNGGLISWFVSKPQTVHSVAPIKPTIGYTLNAAMVEMQFDDAKRTLERHDVKSEAARGGALLNAIQSMQFNDETNLSLKDFIRLHKTILERKLTEEGESVKEFMSKYGQEFYNYQSARPSLRDWLFNYKYADIISAMRKENEHFKKILISIEEKK